MHLSTLNDQLTCKLCGGYFIDATTIIECLHSFCRSCIIKYLENNKYCPICEVQVHKSKPLLNIRPDHTLQDIVYKLVPGCYQNEMRCRREFYSKNPEARSQAGSPESRGEPIESHIYSLDESLSLSLEYYIPNSKEQAESEKESTVNSLPRRYLRCPAGVTVFHLQKLIRAKYGLSDAHKVDIMYNEEPLCGNYTLMDVMYIYHWRRKVPLHLSYRIFESSPKRIKLSEDNDVYEQILSNTRVDLQELKSEQSEKREWKEVQLKISETGVMSVTDISTFEKKNVSNGDSNSDELVTIDKTINRVEGVEKVEQGNKKDTAKEPKKEAPEKPDSQAIRNIPTPNADALKSTRNILLAQKTRKASGKIEGNANLASSESQKVNPTPTASEDSSKAVTRSATENESLGNCAPKSGTQSKAKNNQSHESNQATNGLECPNAKKLDNRAVNTKNNFTNTEGKADSQKENSESVGKEVRNASTSVESKQNVQGSILSFQPKVGQVSNTYSKKIPKEKKSVLTSSRKLEFKTTTEQLNAKSDVKHPENFVNTKSQVAATASLTKLASPVVSPPQSTIVSTQAVNTFVSTLQGGRLFLPAPQVTTCILSNPAGVSNVQNSLSSNKTVTPPPQTLDCQAVTVAQVGDQKPAPTTTVKSDSGGQNVSLVKNNNNNSSSSNQSLASIGLNVSTAMPVMPVMPVQNLVNTPPVKNADLQSEKINIPNDRQGSNASGVQSLSIQSVVTPTVISPRFSAPQTPNASKRTSSQPGLDITSIYTVPPCPDAIPISLMKPTVRKHEIIAKGTNLNEICAKIGESSKEKIKAATRSKPELPNLLKITKKTAADSNKCIPNVSNAPSAYPSGNNTNPGAEKTNVCISKETPKTSSAPAASQSVPTSCPMPLQKSCSVKKQSQPVGYKTLRDPPKSWNPTLSKNNYVAARNQAKEMQNQTQGTLVSGGAGAKPIHSKPAKIFKMRNVPRYLGNPASGVKPMYGVSNESKEKDQAAQNTQKNSSLNMMTIDPKTLSPIVSTANSPIISPPPPYSPNARSYQNTQFPREICRNPGSPISPRNSPVNMLSTNPFIPSPTLNTNPRLIYTPFPPPFPDTSRFPNPLIRSPIGIPSPSAFHSSLPPSIVKYQRTSYHAPVTSYATSTPSPPTIQKILPSMHSSPKSPKSPKSSAAINISPMFTLGKAETQLSTRVENIALHLAKNAAQQELNIFNLSKTGNSAAGNFQNLSTTTTLTLSTSGYTSTETLHNVTTQMTARSKPQLELKTPEIDASKLKSMEPHTVELQSADASLAQKAKTAEGNADSKLEKSVDKKEKTIAKINGDVAADENTVLSEKSDKAAPSRNIERNSVPSEKEPCLKGSPEKTEKSVEINSQKVATEAKSEEAVRKTADQIQGKKSDVQRNKPES